MPSVVWRRVAPAGALLLLAAHFFTHHHVFHTHLLEQHVPRATIDSHARVASLDGGIATDSEPTAQEEVPLVPQPSPPPMYTHAVFGTFLPPPPASVMLTFGSKSVSDFILNWVKNVERIPNIGPYIVACMDDELLQLCKSKGIPAFYARSADIIGDRGNLGTAHGQKQQTIGADRYYRTDGAAFKKMGAVKAATLQMMLETGYDVFISDADVVWFGSPWPVVGGREDVAVRADARHLAEADVLASTDCVDYLEDLGAGLVGHEMNTGMLFLRASPAAIAFTKEWQVRALETTDGHDQTEFNRILHGIYVVGQPGRAMPQQTGWPYLPTALDTVRGGERATNPAHDLDPRRGTQQSAVSKRLLQAVYETFERRKKQRVRNAFWMWHGALKVGILPMAEFLNGHLYFTRRLQEYSGVAPIAVHLTYQFGDTADYVYGKRQRLREHGIWLMEEEAYFTQGNFLVITHPEEGYRHIVEKYAAVASVCEPTDPVQSKCWHGARLTAKSVADGKLDPRDPERYEDPARPHLEVQGWMRGALRNGIMLARKLNRVLVLPRLQCYCERFWFLLEDCRIPAGPEKMPMPYECPMDHIFEPSLWYHHKVDFREPQFLDNPRVPAEVSSSRMRLVVAAEGTTGPAEPSLIEAKRTLLLPRGVSFDAVAAAERQLGVGEARARVMEVKAADLRDGFSACVGREDDVELLNNQMMEILGGHLVEFCSQERNTLINEVAPRLQAAGFDAKKGWNCSYPGAHAVTANPVEWAEKITRQNRQEWIGPQLMRC